MLTVQPRLTNYVNNKAISFKAEGENPETDVRGEEFYREKVDYYKKQAQEFEKLSTDNSNPESLRKMMKGFRVASEALIEGWAVAWGASRGSKFIKSSLLTSKFGKGVKDVLRPIYHGIKSSGKKIGETYAGTISKIKASKFADKFNNFVEGMRKSPVGKYIVKGFEYVGKAFKFVGKAIKAGFGKLAEPFKGKTKSEIYDKTTKIASNTLGVGAGVAGAYNAATDADKRKAEINNKPGTDETDELIEDDMFLDDEVEE